VNSGTPIIYQYDNDSLLTRAGDLILTRNPQNGSLAGTSLGSVTDLWTYNGFGEPTSYVAKYNTTEIFKQQFSYDKLGRITEKTESISGVTDIYSYLYDTAGRLITVKQNNVTAATYTYDDNDNRLSYTGPGGTVNGTYDNQDRLLQYGPTTYLHTSGGEWKSKTIGTQTTQYSYDAFGDLKSIGLPNGDTIEYAVDGMGRRTGKKLNGGWVQKFLYLSQLKPVAELDATDAVGSLFVYGSQMIVPDYMVKGGVVYRIISDHLGSLRLVVDPATGAVIQRMDYDEFGNVVLDTNPGFQPFGFAGGIYDPDTKLVRFGARDYDAETGRWTAKDPLIFDSWGSTNSYQYVLSDPINLIDPEGEQPPLLKISGQTPGSLPPGAEKLLNWNKEIAYPMTQTHLFMSPNGEAIRSLFDAIIQGALMMCIPGGGAVPLGRAASIGRTILPKMAWQMARERTLRLGIHPLRYLAAEAGAQSAAREAAKQLIAPASLPQTIPLTIKVIIR
jgi:RHS repeat-associated protein